jgi:acyl carrier protein
VSASARSIYHRLRTLIAETLGVEESEVVLEASFEDDLNADHRDLADLLAAVEEEFDVVIREDEMASLTTVGDLLELLEDKVG